MKHPLNRPQAAGKASARSLAPIPLKFFLRPGRRELLLLYFAIIAFVLSRTSEMDPKLTIVIATLGLIYVTIRGVAMSQFLAFAPPCRCLRANR